MYLTSGIACYGHRIVMYCNVCQRVHMQDKADPIKNGLLPFHAYTILRVEQV